MRMEGFWPADDDPANQRASVDDPKDQMGWDDDDDWGADDPGREEQHYLDDDEEPGLDNSDQDDWD